MKLRVFAALHDFSRPLSDVGHAGAVLLYYGAAITCEKYTIWGRLPANRRSGVTNSIRLVRGL